MAIKPISPEEVVARMRDLLSRAQAVQSDPASHLSLTRSIGGELAGVGSGNYPDRLDFQSVLKDAVRGVSDAQNVAQSKAQAYQLGDDSITLEDVMISIQKANLAMQGMVQVRNRLVEAYREVMNLQV